jgi:hypothetical protein
VRFGGVENLLGLDSIIARGLHDPSEVLNAKVDFVPLVEKGRGKMCRHGVSSEVKKPRLRV